MIRSIIDKVFRRGAVSAVEYVEGYQTFAEAKRDCEGYDGKAIFEKVSQSTMAVLERKAVYERDGYLFYEKSINYNLMMYLYQLYIEDGFINVCDWGGAMGSTYLQHRDELERLDCRWNIVEQKHYVKFGREKINVKNLSFYYDLSDVPEMQNCIIFSSVLQYLDNAGAVVARAVERRPRYIIFERTPVGDGHYFRIQKVHEPIYEASYAACVYTENEIIEMVGEDYCVIDRWHSLVDGDEWIGKKKVEYKSLVFKRKIS